MNGNKKWWPCVVITVKFHNEQIMWLMQIWIQSKQATCKTETEIVLFNLDENLLYPSYIKYLFYPAAGVGLRAFLK